MIVFIRKVAELALNRFRLCWDTGVFGKAIFRVIYLTLLNYSMHLITPNYLFHYVPDFSKWPIMQDIVGTNSTSELVIYGFDFCQKISRVLVPIQFLQDIGSLPFLVLVAIPLYADWFPDIERVVVFVMIVMVTLKLMIRLLICRTNADVPQIERNPGPQRNFQHTEDQSSEDDRMVDDVEMQNILDKIQNLSAVSGRRR